jgi:drug/metabolite transporter (DMT)-like permease
MAIGTEPNAPRGIALKLAATFVFSLMYAIIKLVNGAPVGEVIFFRSFFALVPLFIASSYTIGLRNVVTTARPRWHIVRSIAGCGSMFLNFGAVQRLPLADVTGLSFVAPIFAVVLAAFMLNEKVGPWRGFAVAAGFAGVLLMLEPHGGLTHIFSSGFSSGTAMAVSGAFFSAFVVVYIRQMSATETSEAIVFYFMTVGAVVGAITMIWWHAALSWEQYALLTICGLLGGLAQLAMTYSYRYAEPSLLASFDYLGMVWAVLFGFFVFGELPEAMVIAGSVVVIAAGLLIAWRERRRHKVIASLADSSLTVT